MNADGSVHDRGSSIPVVDHTIETGANDDAIGPPVDCRHCGRNNVAQRLWCVGCDASLSFAQNLSARDRSLETRADLYQQILDDLQKLSQQPTIDRDACEPIKAFYSAQLLQLKEDISQQERELRRRTLIWAVRDRAYAGRLTDAIDMLENALRDDPADPQLQQLLQEVQVRFKQRELALQAAREARALLHDSQGCLAELRYDEALEKLERALQLEPDNKQIAGAVNRTRELIQQRAAVHAAEPVVRHEAGASEPEVALVAGPTATGPTATGPTALGPASDAIAGITAPAPTASVATFDEAEEIPSPRRRFIEAASQWSSIFKPFLLDNVGWFVGAFLVIAGFVVLIVTFWTTIEQNQILMHSLVFALLMGATGVFFAAAYFMRLNYPQLESSSDVLLVIVALLIPLVFAAAVLTALVPAAVPSAELAFLPQLW